MTKIPFSLYFHIPYCKRKCAYCNFVSFDNTNNIDEYFRLLVLELKNNLPLIKDSTNVPLASIYFGGGTPSVVSYENYTEIFSILNSEKLIDLNTEITMEVNPESSSLDLFEGLKSLGVNRLSIGVQSFNNLELEYLGRLHNVEKARDIINLAKSVFSNVSLDLMFAFPNQTIDSFRNSLNIAMEFNLQHISLYGFTFEHGTSVTKDLKNGIVKETKEKSYSEMYLLAVDTLIKNEYMHYEISNFGKKNFSSKHNNGYWNGVNYLGLGIAAHSYVNKKRFSNPITMQEYENCINNSDNSLRKEELEDSLLEKLMLGLRTSNGVSVKKIENEFKCSFNVSILEKLFLEGLINENYKERIILTPTGMLLNDSITLKLEEMV